MVVPMNIGIEVFLILLEGFLYNSCNLRTWTGRMMGRSRKKLSDSFVIGFEHWVAFQDNLDRRM